MGAEGDAFSVAFEKNDEGFELRINGERQVGRALGVFLAVVGVCFWSFFFLFNYFSLGLCFYCLKHSFVFFCCKLLLLFLFNNSQVYITIFLVLL